MLLVIALSLQMYIALLKNFVVINGMVKVSIHRVKLLMIHILNMHLFMFQLLPSVLIAQRLLGADLRRSCR